MESLPRTLHTSVLMLEFIRQARCGLDRTTHPSTPMPNPRGNSSALPYALDSSAHGMSLSPSKYRACHHSLGTEPRAGKMPTVQRKMRVPCARYRMKGTV